MTFFGQDRDYLRECNIHGRKRHIFLEKIGCLLKIFLFIVLILITLVFSNNPICIHTSRPRLFNYFIKPRPTYICWLAFMTLKCFYELRRHYPEGMGRL